MKLYYFNWIPWVAKINILVRNYFASRNHIRTILKLNLWKRSSTLHPLRFTKKTKNAYLQTSKFRLNHLLKNFFLTNTTIFFMIPFFGIPLLILSPTNIFLPFPLPSFLLVAFNTCFCFFCFSLLLLFIIY